MTFEAKFLNLSTDNYKVHLVDPSNGYTKETVELNETENKKLKCPYEKLSIILTNLTNTEEELIFDLPFCELYTIDKDFTQKITIIKSDKQCKRFDGVPTSKASQVTLSSSKNSNLKNIGSKNNIENYATQPSHVNVDFLTSKNTDLNATMYNKVQAIPIINLPESKKDSKVKFLDNTQDKQFIQSPHNNEITPTGLLINKNQQFDNQNQYYSYNNDNNIVNKNNNTNILNNNVNNYNNFNNINSNVSLKPNININNNINANTEINTNTGMIPKINSTKENVSNSQNNSGYVYKSLDGEKFFNDIFKKEYIYGISNIPTISQNSSKSHIESTSSNFKLYPTEQLNTPINNKANCVNLNINSDKNNNKSNNQIYNNNYQSLNNNIYPSQNHYETYSSKTYGGNRKKIFDLDSDKKNKDLNSICKNNNENTNKIEKEKGISTTYNLNTFDANKFMKQLDDPITNPNLNSEVKYNNFNNINEKDTKINNVVANNLFYKNSETVNQQISSNIQSENTHNEEKDISLNNEGINPKGHTFIGTEENDKNIITNNAVSPYNVGSNMNKNIESSNKFYDNVNTNNTKEKLEDSLNKSLTENFNKTDLKTNTDTQESLSNVGNNKGNYPYYYNYPYYSTPSSYYTTEQNKKPNILENNTNYISYNSTNRPYDSSIVKNTNSSNESNLLDNKDDTSNERVNQNQIQNQNQSYNYHQCPSYYYFQREQNQNLNGTIGKNDTANENRYNYYNNYQYPSYYSSNYQQNSNTTYSNSSSYSNNSGTYTYPFQYPSSYLSTYQYNTNYSNTNNISSEVTLNKTDTSKADHDYSSTDKTSNSDLNQQKTYYIAYEDYNNNRDNLIKLLPPFWHGKVVIAPYGSNIKSGFSGTNLNNNSNINDQNSNITDKTSPNPENQENKNSPNSEIQDSDKKIDNENKISSNSNFINKNMKDSNSNLINENMNNLNSNLNKEIITELNESENIPNRNIENFKENDTIHSSEEKHIALQDDNIEDRILSESEKIEHFSCSKQVVINNSPSLIFSASNSKMKEEIEPPKTQELESQNIINNQNEEDYNLDIKDKNNPENFKIIETISDVESPNKILQEEIQNLILSTNNLKDEEEIINKITFSPKISVENIQEKELKYADSTIEKREYNITPTEITNLNAIKDEKTSDKILDYDSLENHNEELSNEIINNSKSLNSIEDHIYSGNSIAGSSKKQSDKLDKKSEYPIANETDILKSKEILLFDFKKISEFYESFKNFERTIIFNIIKNEYKNNEDILAKKIEKIMTIKNNSTKILYIRVSGENKKEEEFQKLDLNSQITFNRLQNKIHKLQISFNKKGKRGPVFNVFAGYNYIIDKNIQLCDNLGKEIPLSFSRFFENEGEISINNKYFTCLKSENLENLKDLSSLIYDNYISIINGSSQNIFVRVKSDENSDEDSYNILPLMSLFIQRKFDFEFLTEIKNETKNHIHKYKLKSNNIYIYDEKSNLVNLFCSEIIEKQDVSNKIEANKRYRSQALNKISQQLDKQNDDKLYFKFEDYIFDEENLNEFNIENLSKEDVYIRIEKKTEGEDNFFKLNSKEDVWRLREDGLFLMEIVKTDLTSKRYIINTNYCYNIDTNLNLIESVSHKLIPNTLEKLSGYKLIYENIDKEINYNADEILSGFENNEYNSNEMITYFNDIKPKYTRGKKFTDDLFPPKSCIISSINPLNKKRNDSNNLHYYQKIDEKIISNIIFKRPDEIFKDDKVYLFNENNDDKLNFKSYVASIINMLNQNPNVIKRNFKTQEFNQDGFYEIYFYENGIRKVMFVDDYFPVMNKVIEDNEFPIFTEPKLNEIWPQILEKAYAKYEGGYANITDGNVLSEIYFFTGAISYKYSTKVTDQISVWENLISSSSNSAFVLASFYDNHDDDDKNVKSKLSLFTYTVLSSMEYHIGNEIIRLIKMKNPAAALKWQGGYGYCSEKWTPEMKEYFDTENAFNEDGIFFLSFEEFIDQFDFYVVSFVN